MGREFIDAPRKPLSEFVGGFGEPLAESAPWDPLGLAKLYKVSANNPDPAWLREAELKHGRIAMLAFLGIIVTGGGTVHFPTPMFEKAAAAGWPTALRRSTRTATTARRSSGRWWRRARSSRRVVKGRWTSGSASGRAAWSRATTASTRSSCCRRTRRPPTRCFPELKNGRLAMLAVMGIFTGYLNTNANLWGRRELRTRIRGVIQMHH